MKKITISEADDSISEKDIDEIERKLGVDFPEDYRQFLLAFNGGRPEPSGFVIPDDGTSQVHYFLCICEQRLRDILKHNNVYKDRIPKNFVIIAHDPGGNNICLSVAGSDRNKVYFWDHEEEVDEGEIPTYDNCYLIADSFDDLITNKLF